MTTEHAFDSPVYVTTLAAFYESAAAAIAAHLDAGRDVALLSEGDPLFYGSFMHLFIRLRSRYPVTLVPGVTGMAGCWAAAGEPMTWGDDTLLVVPGHPAAARHDRAPARHRRRRHHEARAQFRQSPLGGQKPGCWRGRSTLNAARWTMRSCMPLAEKRTTPRRIFH